MTVSERKADLRYALYILLPYQVPQDVAYKAITTYFHPIGKTSHVEIVYKEALQHYFQYYSHMLPGAYLYEPP